MTLVGTFLSVGSDGVLRLQLFRRSSLYEGVKPKGLPLGKSTIYSVHLPPKSIETMGLSNIIHFFDNKPFY